MAALPVSEELTPVITHDFSLQNSIEYDIKAEAIMAPIFQLSLTNTPSSGIRVRLLQSIEPDGDYVIIRENDKPLSFLFKSDGVRNLVFTLTNGAYYRLQAEGISGELSVKVQDRYADAEPQV